MKFHIVSDSSCDLGRETAKELGITMVSFYAQLGDDVYYREEQDISTHEFYQRMADCPGVYPKTSMPTMDDYMQAMLPHVQRGESVLCICLNSAFSGSCQAARNTREEILEDYPDAKIHVMDSRCVTVLQGALVEEAVSLRDAGYTLEEAVAALDTVRDSGRIFFTANDLDYLRHGGRIGAAAATTGTLLKVKPLIGYENCGLVTDGIAQGRKKCVCLGDTFLQFLLVTDDTQVGPQQILQQGTDGGNIRTVTAEQRVALNRNMEEKISCMAFLSPRHLAMGCRSP